MTEPYVVHGELPSLEQPVLVVAMSGWIDASGAAAGAMGAIEASCDLRTIVTFDGDTFIDYRARRPTMELREGVNTRLVWSDIELKVGHDTKGTPLLVLSGPEPDMQWRKFASTLAVLALQLDVYQMVGLGAYPFAIPHTRASRLSITTPSAELAASLPYLTSTLDVPAGMSAALEHALTEAGIASVGLWVQVPHYLSGMSYPAASAALLDALHQTTGLSVPTGDLAREAEIQRSRIDHLVDGNEEHTTMVRQLETAYDLAPQVTPPLEMTSGDELAAEFERFLRDRDD